MNVDIVTVEVKKMVSDGNYGHEAVQVGFSAQLTAGEDADAAAAELWARARDQCVEALLGSESLNVRRAMNPAPRLCDECRKPLPDEVRGYLHPACDQKLRAELDAARAQRDAERETELPESPF